MMPDTRSYQTGWNEGYAEGYACKLVDMTELFMPAETPAEVEAAADYLQRKYAVVFADRSDAVGVARGVIRAARGEAA